MRILLIPLMMMLAAQAHAKKLNFLDSEKVLTRGEIIKSSALDSRITTYHVIYKKQFYICGVSREFNRALFICINNQK